MLKKIALVLSLVLIFSVGCSGKKATPSDQLKQPEKDDMVAVMKTSMGDLKIKLFPIEAPKAVENFNTLANQKYYDGLTFHRVINNFMIQGGDPTGTGTGGKSIWGEPFPDEFSPNLHNYRGALSMANAGPNTNGSQFFIVQAKSVGGDLSSYGFSKEVVDNYQKLGGTPHLDGKHTVFGQLLEGFDVLDAIAGVKVAANTNKPLQDVKILNVKIVRILGKG